MDRGVIATATELFDGRHYPGVVAVCTDALDDEPECIELLLLRARANMALRRGLDAQADLRDVIRLAPQCGPAYRLLGELAARREEHESAAIFFREALRLDAGDQEARNALQLAERAISHRREQLAAHSLRPAAAAQKLPAPAAAAGRFPRPGSSPEPERLARGTQPPLDAGDERPTKPFARGSERDGNAWKTPAPRPAMTIAPPRVAAPEKPTIPGRPPTVEPARPAPKLPSRPIPRSATPELPGFGDYLVSAGILTRERLRAAQAYQRSMRVQLSTAIVTLGLATPQRIEWAAVAHQSSLARAAAGS